MVAFFCSLYFTVFRISFETTIKTLRKVSTTSANERIKNEKQNKTKDIFIKSGKKFFNKRKCYI